MLFLSGRTDVLMAVETSNSKGKADFQKNLERGFFALIPKSAQDIVRRLLM